MSSTSVTIGSICARQAHYPSTHLNLSELFRIDRSHTSVGVQSLTSTAEHGAATTARLSHRETPSSQTSHRFDPAGGLGPSDGGHHPTSGVYGAATCRCRAIIAHEASD